MFIDAGACIIHTKYLLGIMCEGDKNLVYYMKAGNSFKEYFDSEKERDDKYDSLVKSLEAIC